MSQISFAFLIAMMTIIILIIKLLEYKKEGENKERKILDFYLDWKFLGKIINNEKSGSLRNKQKIDIADDMINLIKAYSQTDDIIIMDQTQFKQNKLIYDLFNKKLQDSTLNFYKNTSEATNLPDIILNAENMAESSYRLYAFCLDNCHNESLSSSLSRDLTNNEYKNFICVKLSSSYTNNEVATLDISIHLLAERYFRKQISLF